MIRAMKIIIHPPSCGHISIKFNDDKFRKGIDEFASIDVWSHLKCDDISWGTQKCQRVKPTRH